MPHKPLANGLTRRANNVLERNPLYIGGPISQLFRMKNCGKKTVMEIAAHFWKYNVPFHWDVEMDRVWRVVITKQEQERLLYLCTTLPNKES